MPGLPPAPHRNRNPGTNPSRSRHPAIPQPGPQHGSHGITKYLLTKRLDTNAITNELEGSSFFPVRAPQQGNENQIKPPVTPPVASEPVTPAPRRAVPQPQGKKLVDRQASTVQPTKRPYIRRTFDFFEDQITYLTRASLEDRLAGGEGSMNAMVREAIDAFIEKRKRK